MTEPLLQIIKISGAGAVLLAAIPIAAPSDGEISVWAAQIERMGSFGLIALFVIAVLWFIGKHVPGFLKELKDEIRQERAAREKSIDAFRDMLSSHKEILSSEMKTQTDEIRKGNEIVRELVHELSVRPCAKHREDGK